MAHKLPFRRVIALGGRMTVDEFLDKWLDSGGSERANTQLFLNDLCSLLDVPPPRPARAHDSLNDYVFERHVIKKEIDGAKSHGWIDCYKRDAFILEAKQGSETDRAAVERGEGDTLEDLFGQTAEQRFKRGMARRGTAQWTGAMSKAAGQAEGYAKALPKEHGWPPFLIVTDVGYCIDIFADFDRSGKGYSPYPDQKRYRITIEQLKDVAVRDRLRTIWNDPLSLDPSAEAARVTENIAGHLAILATRLEKRGHNPDSVASFLMRLLFTMFAEDTLLLPKRSFSSLLRRLKQHPEHLVPQLSDLWAKMDRGGFVGALGEAGETVRWFNGYLFKDTAALPLETDELDILIIAAEADWRQVEPAIFGTLLERALNPKERAQLGAHYTPREYVERLVQATIMDPLRSDWLGCRTAAMQAADAGNGEQARKLVASFHRQLVATQVLDPACGTGNFLYVALARMKELEGEVLELLGELGDKVYLAKLDKFTLKPDHFKGIEVNQRAAKIAQLVLWIGYLQWHFRVNGNERMPDPPVLRDAENIENRDALLDWDEKVLVRDKRGHPCTRWDGETMKQHPVTGRLVPDERAQVELYRYQNARPAKWPKADFIIGNPPFMGAKDIRDRLGDGYFEALFRRSNVPESADFVMHWWDKAATYVRKGQARRFGFVTTNSLPQTFSRRVVKRHCEAIDPLALVFAIPDHPWVSEKGNAAVRIAMTVGEQGRRAGVLQRVIDEIHAPKNITLAAQVGRINSDLTIGANVAAAGPLKSNKRLASPGVKLHGEGFVVTALEAYGLGLGQDPNVGRIIRDYRNGRDLMSRPRNVKVIDLFSVTEEEVQDQFPSIYQHVQLRVRPHREQNNRDSYRLNWWLFGEGRPALRGALSGLECYIATVETAKHRVFQFLETGIVPDNMLIAIALDDPYYLGVLSSRFHTIWALATGGRLGVGNDPRYNKTRCFDTFPFPTPDADTRERIRKVAQRLDTLRKKVLAERPHLTITKIYNGLEALRAAGKTGEVLSPPDRKLVEQGCVTVIDHLHREIDEMVAHAYGWPVEDSDQMILQRLTALNLERAREEANGKVRWLRREFQAPGYQRQEERELALEEPDQTRIEALQWPGALPDQVVAVASIVDRARQPVHPKDVARRFRGKRASTVVPVLDALAGMGRLRKLHDGRYAA